MKAGSLDLTETQEMSGSQRGWPAVIGDPDFARKAMSLHEIGRLRKHRKTDYASTLKTLAKTVSLKYCMKADDLYQRGRTNNRSEGRAYFCFVAARRELLPLSAIAKFLGVTISAVSKLVKKVNHS